MSRFVRRLQHAATVTPTVPAGILKVMPLGDSITEGMRRATNTWEGGYRKVLLDQLNVNYPGRVNFVGSLSNYSGTMSDKDHEGHSGWTTAGINSNITTWMTAHMPDVILLHIGTNDIAQELSASSMISNLTGIMTKIYAANSAATVILCQIAPMYLWEYDWDAPTWYTYNDAIPGIANQFAGQGRSVILADMVSEGGMIAGRPDDMGDGWHPSDSGYTKMANLFMAKLQPLL